jgi:hypothetical protein
VALCFAKTGARGGEEGGDWWMAMALLLHTPQEPWQFVSTCFKPFSQSFKQTNALQVTFGLTENIVSEHVDKTFLLQSNSRIEVSIDNICYVSWNIIFQIVP